MQALTYRDKDCPWNTSEIWGKSGEELRQGEDQIIEQHAAVIFKAVGCRVYEDEDLILWSLSFPACKVGIIMLLEQETSTSGKCEVP